MAAILQNNVNMLDHKTELFALMETTGGKWENMFSDFLAKNVCTYFSQKMSYAVKVHVSNWIPHTQEGNTNTAAVWQSSNVTVQYLWL